MSPADSSAMLPPPVPCSGGSSPATSPNSAPCPKQAAPDPYLWLLVQCGPHPRPALDWARSDSSRALVRYPPERFAPRKQRSAQKIPEKLPARRLWSSRRAPTHFWLVLATPSLQESLTLHLIPPANHTAS